MRSRKFFGGGSKKCFFFYFILFYFIFFSISIYFAVRNQFTELLESLIIFQLKNLSQRAKHKLCQPLLCLSSHRHMTLHPSRDLSHTNHAHRLGAMTTLHEPLGDISNSIYSTPEVTEVISSHSCLNAVTRQTCHPLRNTR